MKSLANCKPSEFLVQTNKIRKSVNKWLTDTDILNIRQRIPNIPKNATADEEKALIRKQVHDNFNAILEAVMEEHPEETLEVLALICFVEPKDVDNYTVPEYLKTITELIDNEAVVGFFTSLANWANRNGQTVAEA